MVLRRDPGRRRDRRLDRAPALVQRNGRCAGKFVRRHVGRVTAGQPASRGAGDRPVLRCSTSTPTSRSPAASTPPGSPTPGDATTRRSTATPCTKWSGGGRSFPVTGMQPVQEDRDRSLRDGAIAAHRGNYDVHQIAGSLTFRDDVSPRIPIVANLTPGSSRSVHRSSRAAST